MPDNETRNIRDLPPRGAGLVDEVARLLAGRTGKKPDELISAGKLALRSANLDESTVAARMHWLFDRDTEGTADFRRIDLLSAHPEATAEEMAAWIVDPEPPLLEFITRNSSVPRESLEAVFAAMLTATSDPYGLPDLSRERVLQEMKWWIVDLAFPDYYYDSTPPEEIAHQILVNRFHEIQGADSESYRNMKVSYVSPAGTRISWVHSESKFMEVEQEMEADYYAGGGGLDVSVYAHGKLLLYIAQETEIPTDAADFETCVPASFLTRNYEERQERYRQMWKTVRDTGSFHIEHSRKESTGEYRLMVGFPSRVINHFMANLSRALLREGIRIRRKYVVACGGMAPMIISSFYADTPFPQDLLARIVDIGLYPDGPLARLTEADVITPAETNFAHAAAGYVHAFAQAQDANLAFLEQRFSDHPALKELFINVRRNISRDTYPPDKITAAFFDHPDVLRRVFEVFRQRFDPRAAASRAGGPDPAGADSTGNVPADAGAIANLENDLPALLPTQEKLEIFRVALQFVSAIMRTNFFLPVKTALAFRLDPGAMRAPDFDRRPYGLFYLRGRNFRGFHVRFGDVARGGIRILTSANADAFRANADTLFEECYNLAATQDRKNKDIPERGAKGVILPDFGHDDAAGRKDAFGHFVDGLLDLLLPSNAANIVNYREEILFLGPDEHTAELMDWACERAKVRGYLHWKAFTTGKSARLGGISHIDYAMTTNSVHRYVLGILRELGIDETSVTKLQTGGPDGDLGGNEILVSNDITIGVVDGGGVVYDPNGLDRAELRRLAKARLDCSNFDAGRLGDAGFLVRVSDRNVVLPDGTAVPSGLTFRNTFHYSRWMTADLFVPCGGRPASINSTNWRNLLGDSGAPRVRWIVEGANLFITPEARLELEGRGVIIFKDSSTNKGGVTSSSHEVLVALAFSDGMYEKLMCAQAAPGAHDSDAAQSSFRGKYIEEILARIRSNADAEFAILWKLRHETGRTITELSDLLSDRILEVTTAIELSQLFEDARLVRNVLETYIPRRIRESAGFDAVLETIPRSYLKAAFARAIAARFVYRFGIDPGYEEYRRFIEELRGYE